MNKIYILTLGCAKNSVDSEHLAAQLVASGFDVRHDALGDARVVVVNTCGFIGDAKQESIETILGFAQLKAQGTIERLVVFGCLSERYATELPAEMPEVDAFFGVDELPQLVEALGGEFRPELLTTRELSTPQHYAYLKISEGCDRACGYCIIPEIRGRHRSVPIEELVAEARLLAAKGVKELLVIAQDTTLYGLDLYGERRLGELLRRLAQIEQVRWIRLHYAYPAGFPDDVIELMRSEPKLCPYLDIPLQHISDRVLSAMRRGATRAQSEALIARLRERVPGIALRTTMLVGYPGETQADFEELKEFVRETRFERLGVFPYSEQEDTYSATRLTDDVPQAEKERRAEELMALQADISLENNLRQVGRTIEVIIDQREGDYWIGRTAHDSPEVDGQVLVTSAEPLTIGAFYPVRITAAEVYELFGEVVNK